MHYIAEIETTCPLHGRFGYCCSQLTSGPLPLSSLIFQKLFKTYNIGSLVRNRACYSFLHAPYSTMLCMLRSTLPTEGVGSLYNSHPKTEIDGTKIVQSSWRIPLFSTSSILCFQILFISEINGMSSKNSLLQHLKIAFSSLNANHRYADRIRISNFFVVRRPYVAVCDEQEKSFSFVFINKASFVYRQFTVLFKSTTDHIIAFFSISFSSVVFTSFLFPIC